MCSQNKIVNLAFLKEMTGNCNESLKELLGVFVTEGERYMQIMKTSFAEKNWQNLGDIAHKAKSSFALLGMDEAVAQLKFIEQSCRDLDQPNLLGDKIEQVSQAFLIARIEIEEKFPL